MMIYFRFDYHPHNQEFTIKMPTKIHEYFADFIRRNIERQIVKLSKDFPSAIDFCNSLRIGGSPFFRFRNGSIHSPDIHVSHRKAKYPTVVMEIAHSQSTKDLAQKAESYIINSNGNVRTVFGLSTKKASLHVWKAWKDSNNVSRAQCIEQSTVCMQDQRTQDRIN